VTEIETAQVTSLGEPEFLETFNETVTEAKMELLRLENGAEGMFIMPGNLDKTKKHPLIV